MLLFKSNLLSDELIGQIIIPVTEFLPEIWLIRKPESMKRIAGWFTIFPLSLSYDKYKTASSVSAVVASIVLKHC